MAKLSSLVFFGSILLLVVHFVGFYFGHYGFDDLHYAELAHDWLTGTYDAADHYSYRWTLLALTSLSYALFGIQDWSSALPALVITVALLYTLYRLRSALGEWVIAIALVLCVTAPWLLFYADKLMPDIYLAAAVLLAWYALFRGRGGERPFRYGLLFALGLTLGFLSKGTIILVAPVLLVVVVRDLLMRRAIGFWRSAIGSGVFFGGCYLLLCWLWLGDPFIRFSAIVENSYLNACSYDQQPWPVLRDRLLLDFWALILREGFAPLLVLCLVGSFTDRRHRFWHWSALGLFVAANFMTISPDAYVPMCLDPRHYLYLIPVGAVSGGLVLDAAFRQKKIRRAVLLLLLLIAAQQWLQSKSWYAGCLIGLALLWGTLPFWVSPKKGKTLVLIGTILLGLASLIPRLQYHQSVQYRQQAAAYQKEVQPLLDSGMVYTDAVQRRLIRYYESFDPRVDTLVHALRELPDSLPPPAGRAWLYLNGHTQYLTGSNESNWPLWLHEAAGKSEDTWRHPSLILSLLAIDDKPEWVPRWDTGARFSFGFERDTARFWNANPDRFDTNVSHTGDASERVAEFSATLAIPLSALPFAEAKTLAVRSNAYGRISKLTYAQWVVAVEDVAESLFWDGTNVTSFFRVYEKWTPFEVRTIIQLPDSIPQGATLKVYLWNPDRDRIWLDNIEITVVPLAQG